MHPDEEALAALAVGDEMELTEEQLEHVRTCAECTETTRALAQTVALARTGASAPPLVQPAPEVWSRVEAAITALGPEFPSGAPGGASASETAGARGVRSLRRTGPVATGPQTPRRLPLGWGAGLAAAGIAVGLLTGRALWQTQPPPPVTTVARAELDTLDTRRHLGDAALLHSTSGVELRVTTSPLDAEGGYLEVWLINVDGKRMVSVGVLDGQRPETFPIAQSLIDEGYVIVDISREGFDDHPEHSGDSLARGKLPA